MDLLPRLPTGGFEAHKLLILAFFPFPYINSNVDFKSSQWHATAMFSALPGPTIPTPTWIPSVVAELLLEKVWPSTQCLEARSSTTATGLLVLTSALHLSDNLSLLTLIRAVVIMWLNNIISRLQPINRGGRMSMLGICVGSWGERLLSHCISVGSFLVS